MMKRKLAKILSAVVMICSLAGCGNQIPEMTDEQMQEVGEFAAITLMKYDANHRSRLVSLELLAREEPEPAPEPTAQPEDTGMKPTADTPVVNAAGSVESSSETMESVLGLPEGMTLTYREMEVCGSYPGGASESDFFSLTATSGNQLLILKFDLYNGTGQEQSLNLLAAAPIFKITVNGDYSRRALTTMLTNDLASYMGAVPAGASNEVILAIEVESSMANSITSLALNLKSESKTCAIQLF